jgi:AcrR family transcriptional regulator
MAAKAGGSIRDRILDAAVKLLKEGGIKRLAQTQIAKAAGIQQGHLTYYFPKRDDLLLGIAARSLEMLARAVQLLGDDPSGRRDRARLREIIPLLAAVMRDRDRTRMLLALVAESDETPSVAERLAHGALMVRGLVATFLGKDSEHPDVSLALGALWGLGLMHFVMGPRIPEQRTIMLLERLLDWLETSPPAPLSPQGPSP